MNDNQIKKEKANEPKKKHTAKKIIVAVVVVIVIVLLLLHFCGKQTPIVSGDLFPGQGNAQDGLLPTLTKEEILERMQAVADASYFSFGINARPVFENGKSKGKLEIENPSNNVYPMIVEIYLKDSGELIYSSGGMMPNQYIENDKLSKVLSKGDYEATAYMIAFDPDTNERLGHQQVGLIITIKN